MATLGFNKEFETDIYRSTWMPHRKLVLADWTAAFSESYLGWEQVETSISKIDQLSESMEFISGLEGGHTF